MSYEPDGRQIAAQLATRYGKLLEAHCESRSPWRIVLEFEGGTWNVPSDFVFKFGYSGLGTDYFYDFLVASGFTVSKAQVVDARPGDVLVPTGLKQSEPPRPQPEITKESHAVRDSVRQPPTLSEGRLWFACQHCSRKIGARLKLAGRTAKCPGCGEAVTVPVVVAALKQRDASSRRAATQVLMSMNWEPADDNEREAFMDALHDWDQLTDQELAQVMCAGSKHEKLRALQVFACGSGKDIKSICAAVDVLADDDEAVRERAGQILIQRDMMPTVAWKLGFELRERSLYPDELTMPLCQFVQKFQETPTLGRHKAERAVQEFRKLLQTGTARDKFEERFTYFTRPESTVTQAEYKARTADKTSCRQCGKKMVAQPQGPYVMLRCDQCDITRFEKSSDL